MHFFISGNIQSFPIVDKNIAYKTPQQKFSKPYKTYIYCRETIEPFGVMLEKQKMAKFQKDRVYLEKVLAETLNEMMAKYSCKILHQRNDEYKQSKQDEKDLLIETEQNKKRVQKLRHTLENEKVDNAIEIERINKRIASLKDEIEV